MEKTPFERLQESVRAMIAWQSVVETRLKEIERTLKHYKAAVRFVQSIAKGD